MDKKICDFLDKNSLLSIATCSNNIPSSATCFYAFNEDLNYLVIKSGETTKHISNALINNNVAGTILPKIVKLSEIKGIQFSGTFINPIGDVLGQLKKTYYKTYPFALVMEGKIWGIELPSIKMTDNTFGFGKKIVWNKED